MSEVIYFRDHKQSLKQNDAEFLKQIPSKILNGCSRAVDKTPKGVLIGIAALGAIVLIGGALTMATLCKVMPAKFSEFTAVHQTVGFLGTGGAIGLMGGGALLTSLAIATLVTKLVHRKRQEKQAREQTNTMQEKNEMAKQYLNHKKLEDLKAEQKKRMNEIEAKQPLKAEQKKRMNEIEAKQPSWKNLGNFIHWE